MKGPVLYWPMAPKDEAEQGVYQPKDAVTLAIQATLIMGGVGFATSAIQNTLTRQNVSGWGVFTRTGGTIGIFGPFSRSIEVAGAKD